jgi:hypothetical protein
MVTFYNNLGVLCNELLTSEVMFSLKLPFAPTEHIS